jgi:hypothetical protein
MSATDEKKTDMRRRLPLPRRPAAEDLAERRRRISWLRTPEPEAVDDPLHSLRMYKAWAARVRATWDQET